MIRLFFQLFAPVFIVTTLFIFNLNFFLTPLFSFALRNQTAYELKGIIHMLDEGMANIGSTQPVDRERKLKQVQAQFLFDLDLLDIQNIQLPPDRKKSLEQGEFVFEPDNDDIIYHVSSNAQQVWKLNIEQGESETDDAYIKRLAVGPQRIILNHLRSIPERDWNQAVEAMSQKFDMPLALRTRDTVDIKPQDLKNLKAQGVIVFQDNSLDRIYSLIPGTGYVLEIGPFQNPLIIRYADQVFIALLGFLMGFVVWLLLRPIWRDLRKLQHASDNFGKGQLETRAHYSRHSPVKKILHAFNGMATHIQQLISSHKELTRAVSHELRTPVSRLRFSLEMLAETKDEKSRRRYLQEMNTDIDELDDLLGELLSYARMDRDQEFIEYTPVLLRDWLQEQMLMHKRVCNTKTLQISHDPKLPSQAVACMDPKLMARALSNLIRNGCRYADQNVHIHLGFNSGKYLLSVDDDGPGIPAAIQESIFEPFTRADPSRDRNSGGYGLGLAIVKQIAEAHQGSVQLGKSELGGAKFIISWWVEPF